MNFRKCVVLNRQFDIKIFCWKPFERSAKRIIPFYCLVEFKSIEKPEWMWKSLWNFFYNLAWVRQGTKSLNQTSYTTVHKFDIVAKISEARVMNEFNVNLSWISFPENQSKVSAEGNTSCWFFCPRNWKLYSRIVHFSNFCAHVCAIQYSVTPDV